MRSTEQVIRDHLDRRTSGDLEGDLAHNYADDLVVISKDGVFHGKDGIRRTAAMLQSCLPDATYRFETLKFGGDVALLGWRATAANGNQSCHGADSFVVRDGRIVAQTIHYDVQD